MCLDALPVLSAPGACAIAPVPSSLPRKAPPRSGARCRAACSRRSRGAVLLEYALVLSAVVVPTMLGASLAGVKMLSDYRIQRDHVMRSTP
jgi:hypothetical protein